MRINTLLVLGMLIGGQAQSVAGNFGGGTFNATEMEALSPSKILAVAPAEFIELVSTAEENGTFLHQSLSDESVDTSYIVTSISESHIDGVTEFGKLRIESE